ncbi:unnamed protein product [Bursaphelenchus xylophilus]|uniref:(pine wood nematode) hypothetical protein n=1 Tax=Bursaphelenchus xylophilus TaxID=6326 RepID=A0A1I7S366_BURXY|nr:unnamed protein product [Bursaphelenchus xylophilus]CAG9116112.1 unnamed protein product [Bursaphelenchus xylophilus]
MHGLGFGIDRGGTFTDVFVVYPDGINKTFKLLSEDFSNYQDAPTEAIRRILNEYTGTEVKRGEKIPTDHIAWIRMGTTVATNALLERKGEPTALLVTKGYKDLLFIGNQQRPKIFDLQIELPETIYDEVVEVDERVILDIDDCEMNIPGRKVETQSGKSVIVETEIDENQVRDELQKVLQKGIKSLAILFIHSYIYQKHEEKVAEIAEELGFINISLSSSVIPMIKAVPRGYTACADAYLTPIIQKYIDGFRNGFVDNLKGVSLEFMQSDGGLCPVERFIGSRAILSGPAGGVVGVSMTSFDKKDKRPIVGFDMGGTSTDVSRYDGIFTHTLESVTAGVMIQAPQLEVNTVAAGGGSRLFFENGLFVVGPESAGSTPGPVCYRKNGYLTVTDANLVLGRILPEYFPKIFGPEENETLDRIGSYKAFQELCERINAHNKANNIKEMSVAEAALGFVQVANETMCRPIRTLTESRGYDTANHVLACFGGAGGQHACAIARALGMKKVKIHKYAGILSAYGLALADAVVESQEAFLRPLSNDTSEELAQKFRKLEARGESQLKGQGFKKDEITFDRILHMRYDRTDCVLVISRSDDPSNIVGAFTETFESRYKKEFGFVIKDRSIIVEDLRVRTIGQRNLVKENGLKRVSDRKLKSEEKVKCSFKEGELETDVFLTKSLNPKDRIKGPAIIIDPNSTILIEPNCLAIVDDKGDIEIEIQSEEKKDLGVEVDPIQLSIFSHRFMSIAEQMGTVLRRAAISTNIKERLDFSCALFSSDGGLIANAPHIPVHLGGMQATVKFQIQNLKDNIHPNDVILCNHPSAGGSHLPDLTVITPVFYGDSQKPEFFLANRGHHSDIGGLVPGSMPPHSTNLNQEGATFISFKIVDKGEFKEKELTEEFMKPGRVPGCSGSRNLRDNIADLNAQIAANQKGIHLLNELVQSYSLEVVQAYMGHIKRNAETAVRTLLKDTAVKTLKENGRPTLLAEDFMDDGTRIALAVHIDQDTGDATFDFTGTGLQVYSSCNTPPAVRMAAIIYCLRCLIGKDIPLNQGCLEPIQIVVPDGTIISPSEDAAVVGGNVLTSQRLCDVIFKAFKACAASQGCMNNITFGDDKMGGYYETVAGGAGAGPGYNGRSAIHSHMTNTRITDPEILESRYPIILREFGVRQNSGGSGRFKGGDGVTRTLQFRRPLQLSVLTERRVFRPYGLIGGEDGDRGSNTIIKTNGTKINLGGKNSITVNTGDIFELKTPGGGGYGSK